MGNISGDIFIGIGFGFGIAAFLVSLYFLLPIFFEKKRKIKYSKKKKTPSAID